MSDQPTSAPASVARPKPPLFKCTLCALIARKPLVVPVGAADAGAKWQPGRCSNRQACASRQRRNKNRSKENRNA